MSQFGKEFDAQFSESFLALCKSQIEIFENMHSLVHNNAVTWHKTHCPLPSDECEAAFLLIFTTTFRSLIELKKANKFPDHVHDFRAV